MAAKEQNDEMVSGDTRNITYTVDDGKSPPSVVPITNASVKWGCFRTKVAVNAEILKDSNVGGEITINGPAGQFTVHLDPADTEAMSGAYPIEAELVDSSGNKSTVAFGILTVIHDSIQ